MEGETGVMLSHSWSNSGQRGKEGFSSGAFGGSVALLTSYFRLLVSRMMREQISVVLRNQICDKLLLQPQKSNVVRVLVSTRPQWQGRGCLKGECLCRRGHGNTPNTRGLDWFSYWGLLRMWREGLPPHMWLWRIRGIWKFKVLSLLYLPPKSLITYLRNLHFFDLCFIIPEPGVVCTYWCSSFFSLRVMKQCSQCLIEGKCQNWEAIPSISGSSVHAPSLL